MENVCEGIRTLGIFFIYFQGQFFLIVLFSNDRKCAACKEASDFHP